MGFIEQIQQRLTLGFALTVRDARIHMTSLGYYDAMHLYLLIDYRQQSILCANYGQSDSETG